MAVETIRADMDMLVRGCSTISAPGDVVTVTRLDRLARSWPDLLAIAVRIKKADAGLRSLAETWADTTTPDGCEMLTVLAGIVDFERSLIVERTSAGRGAAQAEGVKFGRPPILSVEQITYARRLIDDDKKPVAEVAQLLKVHRATLYRALDSAPRSSADLQENCYVR